MYWLQQPATCNACGHKQPANGTDDEDKLKIDGNTVCPKCLELHLRRFCGAMIPDTQSSERQP